MVKTFHQFSGNRPIAIVTGGARRVGAAICRALAAAGCDIALTYRTSADEASQLVHELASTGAAATCLQLDLGVAAEVEAFIQAIKADAPRLDVIVHNASRYHPTPLDSISQADLRSFIEINALSPACLSASLAPMLGQSPLPGGGAIIAMGDIHAMGRPRKDFLAYSMSKAAITEMVQSLAVDLAPAIRVNGVAPGVVAFPEHGFESDPEMQQAYLRRVPLGRSGTPEDAAEVVRWLALDATYLTGEILRVDGGRWLR